jgi:hypothetical protein
MIKIKTNKKIIEKPVRGMLIRFYDSDAKVFFDEYSPFSGIRKFRCYNYIFSSEIFETTKKENYQKSRRPLIFVGINMKRAIKKLTETINIHKRRDRKNYESSTNS